jgi:actin-related protein
VLTLGHERFRCTEILFQPSLRAGDQKDSLHELVHQSITSCDDINQRSQLYTNIVLSGGNTMYQNNDEYTLDARLLRELKSLIVLPSSSSTNSSNSKVEPKMSGSTNRRFGAWIGASILASLPLFQTLFITQAVTLLSSQSFSDL